MTRFLYLIINVFTILIGLVLSGCVHKVDPTLTHVERIMEEHPDSALMILEGLSLPEKVSEEDRALYIVICGKVVVRMVAKKTVTSKRDCSS